MESAEKLKQFDMKETVRSMRTTININQMEEEDWEEEKKCEELRKKYF